MDLMNTTIQLKTLLQKVLEENKTEAKQRGNTLSLAVDEDVPDTLSADLIKLTQALNALIQQAILRTENGSIVLRAQPCRQDPAGLSISVEDTGWEPDPEKIHAVLNPKTSASVWRQDEKLAEIAMPLQLSAKFISLLGSQLEMESASKNGTCFSFLLSPRSGERKPNASIAQAKESAASSDPDGSKQAIARILLVDDVLENRTLLEVLLKKIGYVCSHSANGQEAVDLCEQEKFDLILMDLQMPILDGIEATRKIRTGPINAKTPIIAMTASGQKGDDLKALNAGCNDCLGKPISRELLQRKIWRQLAQVKQIQAADEGREILSFLEGDPDYQKAIETFVDCLPGKIEEMKKAFEKRDLKDLAFKTHALKGLGGFAGFPIFTEKAKALEETVKAEDYDRIREQLDEMVQLCMRTKLQGN
jgi:CheY-like chemotaxis protein